MLVKVEQIFLKLRLRNQQGCIEGQGQKHHGLHLWIGKTDIYKSNQTQLEKTEL